MSGTAGETTPKVGMKGVKKHKDKTPSCVLSLCDHEHVNAVTYFASLVFAWWLVEVLARNRDDDDDDGDEGDGATLKNGPVVPPSPHPSPFRRPLPVVHASTMRLISTSEKRARNRNPSLFLNRDLGQARLRYNHIITRPPISRACSFV